MNKGLPRNLAFPAMLPPPREERDDEDDDDGGEEEAEQVDPNASPMIQFLSTVTPLIPGLVATWQGKKAEEVTEETPAPVAVNGMAHLARVQQQLTPRERVPGGAPRGRTAWRRRRCRTVGQSLGRATAKSG